MNARPESEPAARTDRPAGADLAAPADWPAGTDRAAPADPLARADLATRQFEDTFTRSLAPDPETGNFVRQVPGASYSRVSPTPVSAPRLLAWSEDCAALLGLSKPQSDTGPAVDILAGNLVLPTMRPYAARYGGHQFGAWAGQLGDGRAITLGELSPRPAERWELQLKGAGRTPYSRTADGRAVLRSSVREFLCSEAMHFLGVPTTRALSLVMTGDRVVRDMFYDGNPQAEPGAIVCRVAPSFVRFGNFEIHASRGERETLQRLADYIITEHFTSLGPPTSSVYGLWFEEICRRTAITIAHWMRVGFVHGVMNTDNMSILGLTIDYGPYGWLEGYDPAWTPNTTDLPGRRYAYGRQAEVAAWNLARLATALHPLIEDIPRLERGLEIYASTFTSQWRGMLAAKLGCERLDAADEPLIAELFGLLRQTETDLTLFFRGLAAATPDDIEALRPAFYDDSALDDAHRARLTDWLRRYARLLERDGVSPQERVRRMNRANPKYVLRNYLAQEAIDAAAEGQPGRIERLLRVLQHPYDEQPGNEDLAQRRPEWARHKPGCSALSCSS
ncbi:MAG TPA: YdiU family protein [Steroidobacteraceae bacterium]|nr:YdiU family protein [Steroidobacteraceae bacterium]